MEVSKNLIILKDNVIDFCNSRDDIVGFCGRISKNLLYKSILPQKQPVQKLIEKISTHNFSNTKNILDSIIKANYEMKWNTTYSENEVGADFINRYGWFDLIGPSGPFYLSNNRIMIGYWGVNLDYQMHWHKAEEAYVPIAGSALFWSEHNGTKTASIGDIVIHKSNEKHWTKMTNDFLLALAIWKGKDLSVNPTISSQDGSKLFEVKEKNKNNLVY